MKFTIRDILWLTLVAGLALGWGLWWASTTSLGEPVTGSVVVAGTPLASGQVCLHSVTDGQIVGGVIVKGKYAVQRVPLGKYRVTVEGNGVPAKYANGQGGLIVEVRDGMNHIDLDLL